MPPYLLLKLHPDAVLIRNHRHIRGVQVHGRALTFENPSKGIQRFLKLLNIAPVSEERLEEEIAQIDAPDALSQFYYCIRKLQMLGAICYTLAHRSRHLMTFVPKSTNYKAIPDTVQTPRGYRLSPFAYLHRDGKQMVLESPISQATAVIHSPAIIEVLMRITRASTLKQLAKEFPRLGTRCIETLLNLLLHHQFLENAEGTNLFQWEFHDLVFHTGSRMGRSSKPFGGTFRLRDRMKPLPALKPQPSGKSIVLERPNRKVRKDASFSAVLEKRKSIRRYDDQNPITIQELGQFLYSVARVKNIRPPQSGGSALETTARPYPAGGACYELELYLVIRLCKGIHPGFYYYNPQRHRLFKISETSSATDQLLEDARNANGEGMPQILICIAARFGRIFWKYEAMGYATILKDVGVLYQTMYLVATAMGLGPCALGAGDSDLFAAAAGTDYYAETSVGEFMLGSKMKK